MQETKKNKVAIGLSGGVDSAVSAALLVEQGFGVTGVHLVCFEEPGCRAPQDRKDALAVAMQLGIPFEVLDYQKQYKEKVIEYFYREYGAGRTPNPDVMCNLEIKFGLFMQWALKKGYDYMATGHYARIRERVNNSKLKVKNYVLLRGVDPKKDQSYFLYRLGQEQLKRILFPIGDLTKKQVRTKARKLKLPVADKPDSQGICFLGDIDTQEFLRRRIKEKRGEVADTRGNVIGEHMGVWFYTIGQREGFGLHITKELGKKLGLNPTHLPPLYVVGKDVVQNRLIVGTSKEAGRDEFEVSDVHWIGGRSASSVERLENLKVRIRHGGKLIPATIKSHNKYNKSINRYIDISKNTANENKRLLMVKLSEPQRGVAPGQSAVFYRGEECLGGGTIQ